MLPEITGYDEAAAFCGISDRQLRRAVRRKKLRAFAVGHRTYKFRKSDLVAYVESKATCKL